MGAAGASRQGSDPGHGRGLPPGAAGRPRPVFVECPIDLLYDEEMVRNLYGAGRGGKSLADKAVKQYLRFHVNRLFSGAERQSRPTHRRGAAGAEPAELAQVVDRLLAAQRPSSSWAARPCSTCRTPAIWRQVGRSAPPVYLSGMARGLLGRDHPSQMRHKRRGALREADFVLLAGVPCDFQLDYGNHIRRSAGLRLGQPQPGRPDQESQAIDRAAGRPVADAAQPGRRSAGLVTPAPWSAWIAQLRA